MWITSYRYICNYNYIYIIKQKYMENDRFEVPKNEKRETKKAFPFMIRPTIKERAAEKAAENNQSLSEVVDILLEEYSKEFDV